MLLALAGLSSVEAGAGGFTPLEAAWKEAVVLAGVPEASVRRPGVVEAAQAGPVPYYNLVEAFLHSIYCHARSVSLAAAARADCGTWVREKMAWRVRSRAYRATPAPVTLSLLAN